MYTCEFGTCRAAPGIGAGPIRRYQANDEPWDDDMYDRAQQHLEAYYVEAPPFL